MTYQWPEILRVASFLPYGTWHFSDSFKVVNNPVYIRESPIFAYVSKKSTAWTQEPTYTLSDWLTSLSFLTCTVGGSLRSLPPLTFYGSNNRAGPSRCAQLAVQISITTWSLPLSQPYTLYTNGGTERYIKSLIFRLWNHKTLLCHSLHLSSIILVTASPPSLLWCWA